MIDPKLQEKLDKLEAPELVGEKVKVLAKLKAIQAEMKEIQMDKGSERIKVGKLNQKLETELEIIFHIEKILKDKDF